MESLVDHELFDGIYKGRKVFVTGHTGFKGTWLVSWLTMLGADVTGYSFESDENTRHYALLKPRVNSVKGDIRDHKKITDTVLGAEPEIVFHLAAQPLVRRSYKDPVATYHTNVMGTLNLYEACRRSQSVKAIVSVTSDKVYENKEALIAYRESDVLGGYDMYSSSKACVELMTNSYRKSFFNAEGSEHTKGLVTARAGNVIGGGDWAEDRLIPDIMRAIEGRTKLFVRSPNAVRPWQHVLEPLSGYLLLGQRLFANRNFESASLNFGPSAKDYVTVAQLLEKIKKTVSDLQYEFDPRALNFHEAGILTVDSSLAKQILGWSPLWDVETSVARTARWYDQFINHGILLTYDDIIAYVREAIQRKTVWTS